MTLIPTRKGNLWRALACVLFLLGCSISAIRAADVEVIGCDLESAISGAQEGDTVVFTEDCDVTLSDTVQINFNLTIDAQGHNVTVSGDGSFLLFSVGQELQLDTSQITFEVYGVGFSGGSNTNGGAFYIDDFSSVLFSNCTFAGNIAAGTNGLDGVNGANSGTGNGGTGTNGKNGSAAYGGAIYSLGGLGLLNCSFVTNSATGGSGGNGGNGGTGAENAGSGGNGGAGAQGNGGAVYNAGTDMVVSNCTFSGNSVQGGDGGTGGAKGASGFGGLAGNGATGAAASGAAIYSTAPIIVVNSTFNDNTAQGGNSAAGGLQVNGNGSAGANGGNSFGGGIYAAGSAVTNCTFYHNNAAGGAGGDGGNGNFNAGAGGNGGNAAGGGLYSLNGTAVVSCTFSNCNAIGGTNGIAGSGLAPVNGTKGASHGGNLASGGGTFELLSTILATNRSGGAGFGTIRDAGYNITFGNTITLVSGSGSFKTNNPNLGALANNGGPTMTMALLANSAARDKVPIDSAFDLDFDQRGLPRRVNGTNDIGAFEYQSAGAPVIAQQPTNSTAQFGSNATYFISVAGTAPFTYRMYLSNTLLTNLTKTISAATTSFTITNVTLSNAGPYHISVSNQYAPVATSVDVSNHFAPTIVTNPVNRTVNPGDTVAFSVAALGDFPLSYQWQLAGTNLPSATASNFTIVHVQSTDVGTYTVAITNAYGSVTSAPATLNLFAAIVTPPSSQVVTQGSTAVFTVVADGSPPLSYQWRKDGSPISAATASAYQIDGVRTSNAGNYDVVVTNQFNSVTSSVATLTVKSASSPTLAQPKVAGSNFTFTFPTESGVTYVTESRTNLSSGAWIPLATNSGTGNPVTVTNPVSTIPSRFFRVRVQ
jgi:hypothetical protein